MEIMLDYGWLIIAAICFVLALATDEELRKEFKDIRYASAMICMMIALYYSIMYVAKEWITWCL